jgi:sec-independent protein translocase protein TatA
MPFRIGGPELLIVLVLVVLLFGVGKISKLGGELGAGIKAFRENLKGDDEDKKEKDTSPEDEK